MNSLPKEILDKIIKQLPVSNIGNLTLTDKRIRKIVLPPLHALKTCFAIAKSKKIRPIYQAAESGRIKVVKYLLRRECDPNIKNCALLFAAEKGASRNGQISGRKGL